MSHQRIRHILPLLLKKLRFSPVVAIQGARQTGKSYLVRELLQRKLPGLECKSFDRLVDRQFAQSNPESFLAQFTGTKTLAIDEAQKVPEIFDAIKYEVDTARVPGKYLLLGSTEFSKLSLIRESLTGRLSRILLFPMNIAESLSLPNTKATPPFFLSNKLRIKRAELMRYLVRGGMPGIFAVRSDTERESLLRDWLTLTCERDALHFPRVKIDPDLCMQILILIATLDEPDLPSITKSVKRDPRRVKTHLEVLSTLFSIYTLLPHPLGTGKPRYFLCDVAFAALLGANFERQLYTWVMLEQLAQRSYQDKFSSALYFYRTSKGSLIHLIASSKNELSALKIFSEETVNERDLEILRAFSKKASRSDIRLFGLGASRQTRDSGKIEIYPWESLV